MTADERRAELQAMTPQQIADILNRFNPFAEYTKTRVKVDPAGCIEAVLRWEQRV